MVGSMNVTTRKLEVRGKERKTSQKGSEYIIVRFEDAETGESIELCDRDVERFDSYERGKQVKLELEIKTGKFTSITIVSIMK